MRRLTDCLKSPQVWGFFVSIAVMAVISLVFFAPDNFEGNSLQQSDMQQGAANGHESQLYQEQTGEKALWTNSLFSGMPTFQISPSYPSNSLFTWLNTVYGLWLPSPSNLLFMMMFGFLIMLYCMRVRWPYALIGAVAWGFSSYFIIIIGAGHIWKFLALTYIPPTIGGMVLCYRRRYLLGAALTALFAMLQLNANHPQMSYYFAFVMLAMAIAYLITAVREHKVRQWAAASAIVVGAGLLAVGANLPSLYNTYEYAKETKRAQSELTPLPSPNAEPAERPTGGLPKGDIVNWSYGGSEMFSLLVPDIKGGATVRPEKGGHTYMSLDRLDAAKAVTPELQPLLAYFPQYFNDSEGTNGPVYVGALICALFLLGCCVVRGPMKWALLAMTVISMLLALGRNFGALTDFMIYNFPMYSKFRAVESILVIAEFTMPLLAVLGLAKFMQSKSDASLKALYCAFGFPALLCLVGILFPGLYGSAITSQDRMLLAQVMEQSPKAAMDLEQVVEQLRYGMLTADCWRSLIILLLGFGALWLYAKGKLNGAGAVACVGVLVLIDLYTVDKRYVSHDSFAKTDYYTANYYDPYAPDELDKAISSDTSMSYRVMDIPGFAQAARSYHHKMIGGYHAAKLNRYEDLIQRRMQYVLSSGYYPEILNDSIAALYPADQQDIIRNLQADYRVLDMLNARYIITGDKEAPLVRNNNALGNAWLIDQISYVDDADAEMAALGSLDPAHQAVADKKFLSVLGDDVVKTEPGDSITLTYYSPNTLKYRATTRNGGIGVFSEVYFPWGWRATIDGKPAELGRVNYVLRAMRIPAGTHEVVMTFNPDSIGRTSAVAYACVTLIYLLLIGAVAKAWMRRENAL